MNKICLALILLAFGFSEVLSQTYRPLTGTSVQINSAYPSAGGVTLVASTGGAAYTLTFPSTAPGPNSVLTLSSTGGTIEYTNVSTVISTAGWALTGNNPTQGTDFLGTTNGKYLEIRTNNLERMRIASDGNIGIGDASPLSLLTVGSGDAFQVNSSGAIAAVTGITTSGGYTQSGTGANTITGATTITNSLGVTGTTSINVTGSSGTSIGNANSTTTILGPTDINASANNNTNINTGTSTGAVTIGNSGATVTIGTLSTALNTGTSTYDRVVIANSDGRLEQASFAAIVAAGGGGSGWSITGNAITSSGGSLGSAPTGQWLGTSNANDLRFATNGLTRMIIASDGSISAQRDAVVNSVTVGRGGNNVATNLAVGTSALAANTSGLGNVATGAEALAANEVGRFNTASGYQALSGNVSGYSNTAVGEGALKWNVSGNNNTASGFRALHLNEASSNTAFGLEALRSNVVGEKNVAIGNHAGYYETGSDKLYIANSSTNNLIYGDFMLGLVSINAGSTPSAPGAALQVNAPTAATKGVIVRGASSQTGNLLELQNNSGTALVSISSAGSITLVPYGASAGNTNEIRFQELAANGSNYVGFKAADALSADRIWTLPSADGTNGQVLTTDGSGALSWTTALTGSTAWTLAGNNVTNPATQFLGTTSSEPLVIRTNNTEKLRVSSDGNVGIGDNSPAALLTVGSGDAFQVNSSGAIAAVTGITTSGGYTQSGTGANTITGETTITNTLGVTGTTSINLTGSSGTSIGNSNSTTAITGPTNVNTSGSATTTIGNASATNAIAGVTTITGGTSINATGTSSTTIGNASSTTSVTGAVNVNASGNGNTTIGNASTTGTTTIATNSTSGRLVISGLPTGTSEDVLLINGSNQVSRITQANLVAGQGWSLTGNTLSTPTTQYLGSNNATPLNIRTNSLERMRVTSDGLVLIGSTSGTNTLDVTGTFGVVGAASINTTGTAVTNINTGATSGNVTIGGSGSMSILVGNGTGAQTISLGDGITGAKTVTLGSTAGTSTTTIQSGSGNVNINNNSNQATNINSGTSTGAVNIGAGASSGSVTIGGAGTQTIAIGNGAAAKTVSLGSNSSTSTTTLLSGSGGLNLNASNNQPTNINTGTSSGALNLGSSASTTTILGTTNINNSGVAATNIATGSSAGTVTIGHTNATLTTIGSLGHTGTSTFTGTASINTTGTATTAIGNATGTFTLTSPGLNVASTGNVSDGNSDVVVADNLDVTGSGTDTYVTLTNTTSGTGATDGLEVGLLSDLSTRIWNYESAPLVIGTSGTEILRIASDGNVVVSSPASPAFSSYHLLLSNQNNASYQLRIQEPNGSGSNYSSFQTGAQDYDFRYTLPLGLPVVNSGLSVSAVTGSTGGGYDITLAWVTPGVGGTPGPVNGTGAGVGQLAWWSVVGTTDGTDQITSDSRLYWDNSNLRLGVGSASPDERLDVEGNLLISNGATSASKLMFAEPDYLLTVSNSQTTAFIAQAQDNNLTYTLPAAGPASGVNGSNHFALATNSTGNSATLTWQTFWSPQGNTGTDDASAFLGTTDAQGLVIKTNNTERLRVLSTGNVGIGDATPSALFTVGNGDLFQVNSSGAIAAVTGITISGGYTQSGTGSNTITGATTVSNTLGVTGTTSINVTGSSGTSIGNSGSTTTVLGPANINATGTSGTSIGNSGSTTTVLGPTNINATGTSGTNIGTSGSTNVILGVTSINNSGSAATNIGTGTSAGIVTIGRSGGTLSFTGTLGHTGVVTINNNANHNTSINTGTSNGIVAIGSSASTTNVLGTTNINTTGSAATSIGNTGAAVTVGRLATAINSSVPVSADRVVLATSTGSLEQASISAVIGASGWSLTGNNPTEGTNYLGTSTNKYLEIRTNNVERMRVAADGNVGIGTATASHQLTVAGNATTSTLLGPLYVAGMTGGTSNGVALTLDATNDGGNIYSMVAGGSATDIPGGFGVYQSGTAYRMAINSDGEMHIGSLSHTTDHLNFGSTLNVRGNASIGSNYWDDAAPANGLLVEGNVGVGTTGPISSKLTVVNATDGNKGLVVVASAGQTANLLEVQNSGGTALVSVGSSGALTATVGATISGATTSINENSNFTTNINTGTSTGAVNIGTGSASGAVSIGRSDGTSTITGTTSINADVNNATNINTGTSTGAVNIGSTNTTITIAGPTNINTVGTSAATVIGSTDATVSVLGGVKVSVVVNATGPYTVGNEAVVIQKAAANVTLPAAEAGRLVIVRNASGSAFDVTDGAPTPTTITNVPDGESRTFISDGTDWYVIGN